MAYVTVINEHAHVQQIVSGHHHLTADEPVAAGGSDAGFARARAAAGEPRRLHGGGAAPACGPQRLDAGEDHGRRALVARCCGHGAHRAAPVVRKTADACDRRRSCLRSPLTHRSPRCCAPGLRFSRRSSTEARSLQAQGADVDLGAVAGAHVDFGAAGVGYRPRQRQVVGLHREHVVARDHRREIKAPVGVAAHREAAIQNDGDVGGAALAGVEAAVLVGIQVNDAAQAPGAGAGDAARAARNARRAPPDSAG